MNGLVGGPLLVGDLKHGPLGFPKSGPVCAVFGGSPPSFYFTTLQA